MSSAERKAFDAELIEIREKGYAIARDENHIGVSDYAVLVGNLRIGLTAALAVASLTATRAPGDRDRLLQALHESASTITESLGLSVPLA